MKTTQSTTISALKSLSTDERLNDETRITRFKRIGIACAMALLVFLSMSATSSAQTSITIGGGLAIPNDQVNNVYNSLSIADNTSKVWSTLRESTKLGYDLNVRLRFPLAESIFFDGGVGFARFPQSTITVADPSNNDTLVQLLSTQNVVPISAGLDYFLFRSVISPYVSAELQYNYMSSTVDYAAGNGIGVPLNLDTAPVDSRVGAAVGAGFMLNLAITSLNVDLRYHMVNLVGKTSDEQSKSYVSLNLGLAWGFTK